MILLLLLTNPVTSEIQHKFGGQKKRFSLAMSWQLLVVLSSVNSYEFQKGPKAAVFM